MRLAPEDHRLIALWAAECAARALPCFEERYPDDPRPRAALEAVTGWAHHQLELPVVRQSSFAAFAAARKDERGAASLAALAAGHAAASAQKLRHARHAASYAQIALHFTRVASVTIIGPDQLDASLGETREAFRAEELWQFAQLPQRLRVFVFPKTMLN
jgi:hypothetical protein